jgi:hypothetical protein
MIDAPISNVQRPQIRTPMSLMLRRVPGAAGVSVVPSVSPQGRAVTPLPFRERPGEGSPSPKRTSISSDPHIDPLPLTDRNSRSLPPVALPSAHRPASLHTRTSDSPVSRAAFSAAIALTRSLNGSGVTGPV